MMIALTPILLAGVYLYGLHVLAMLAVATAICVGGEYLFLRPYREPVTTSIFVTSILYVLSLPPGLPLWMTGVGAAFAVVFGKMVFGGFGKNIYNPALAGRAFIYISFGREMTALWREPFAGFPGGFGAWVPDAITRATPGIEMKAGAEIALEPLFLGNTSGVIGGTAAWLVLLGGAYILWKKAANYRLVLSCGIGFLIVQTLIWFGVDGGIDPLRGMLGGAFLIGAFFYATEPVSACKTNPGRWIYGFLIGALSALIATLSNWPAGTMFAILLANTFAPIIDYAVQAWQKRNAPAKKARA